jgi:hypothetical protein
MLLRNLIQNVSHQDIDRLRAEFRPQVIAKLQGEMAQQTKKIFPRVHFLKKFVLYDGLCKAPSTAEPGTYDSVDLVQNNLMDIFECDPSWPICLFDFTIKQKCPTQFVFRTGHLLTSFVNPDYFYSQGSQ